jgi:hypothetical protein
VPKRGRIVVVEDGADLLVRPFEPAKVRVLKLAIGAGFQRRCRNRSMST